MDTKGWTNTDWDKWHQNNYRQMFRLLLIRFNRSTEDTELQCASLLILEAIDSGDVTL